MIPPYFIPPLSSSYGNNGYIRARFWRQLQVERFRQWREATLRNIMREDMLLRGQLLNGRGIEDIPEVEIDKPRSLEYES